jgi:quercetin dioxygenase-like cupin family protein
MRIFRGVLGKVPSGPKSRVRNFIANKELGTQSDIHENVISPGVTVPWHYHETEEAIIVLEGSGECRTEASTESYSAGDVVILPARVKHSLRNPGSVPIRQICVSQATLPQHSWSQITPGQTVDVFNPSDWAKANP